MTDATTRDRLKLAARRLFAARGFDGVSVRDIIVAAGQRNSGSLHYYFGTKEELARELVADGAKLIDDRRNRLLDEMESKGGPTDLRQVIEVLVWPSIDLAEGPDQGGTNGEDTYIRFISVLQMSHRQLFLDALEGRWNSGYLRCLEHIRHFLKGIDPEVVNQRLVFLSLFLRTAMSSREAALEHGGQHHFWCAGYTMENLIDTIEGLLRAELSQQTRLSLHRERRARTRQAKPNKHKKSAGLPV